MPRESKQPAGPSTDGDTPLVRVNLGSGDQTPEEWINVDYALGAWFAKLPLFSSINRRLKLFNIDWDEKILLHNLRKTFPWDDSSVDVVYSSHTLEHFSRSDGKHFLRECHRVLKTGGIIRIVVPDLRALVDSYVRGEIGADEFVDRIEVRYDCESDGFLKRRIAPFIRIPHRCMYDAEALIALMSEVGFKTTTKQPFESDIADLDSVELEDRTQNAVIVEGTKA